MAAKAPPRLHDRVLLNREIAGVPAGSSGSIVQTFEGDMFGVELDDPDLTGHPDGIVDVPADALDATAAARTRKRKLGQWEGKVSLPDEWDSDGVDETIARAFEESRDPFLDPPEQ